MIKKALIVFAQPEERDGFLKSLKLNQGTTYLNNPDLKSHELKTIANDVFQFLSYTSPEIGSDSILRKLGKILEITNPDLVFNIGIAGRVDDNLNIGDVIIGDSLFEYIDGSKAYDEGKGISFMPFAREHHPDYDIPNLFGNFIDSQGPFSRTYENYKYFTFNQIEINYINKLNEINVKKGAIITGPFVDVSNNIKKLYTQINRKIAVVEMEACAVQKVVDDFAKEHNSKAIRTIYIKGVSDFANVESKDLLDEEGKKTNRKFALFNVSLQFKRLINNIDLFSEKIPFDYNHIDEIFNKKHLNDKLHFKKAFDKNILNSYSNLFKHLIDKGNTGLRNSFEFKDITNLILNSPSNLALKVNGFSGSGKSSLLVSLFYFLLQKFNDDNNVFPIYLNLDYYYTRRNKCNSKIIDLSSFIIKSFELDINNAEKILDKLNPSKIVLIIDAIDYNRDSPDLLDYFHHVKMFRNIGTKLVFGVQTIPVNTILNYQSPDNEIQTSYELNIKNFKYDDSELKEFIDSFLMIKEGDNQTKSTKIYRKLKSNKLQDIDLFILSLLYKKINSSQLHIHKLMKDYIMSHCRQGQIDFNEVSNSAFDFHIERPRDYDIEDYNHEFWKIIHQNPKLAYYLIAEHVITSILKIENDVSELKYSNLGFVFPFQINYFCKEIINESIDVQHDVFNKIKIILGDTTGVNWHTKAVACYLAGRLTDEKLIEDSKNLLNNFLIRFGINTNVIKKDDNQYDKYLFTLRTIYISLTYLGDKNREDEYFEMLIKDKDWDNINRGFHLVYYGDQKYIPKMGLAQNDNLKEFDSTFEQLFLRITSSKKSKIFNIELFTLISLVFKRINTPYLSDIQVNTIIDLLNDDNIISSIDNNYVLTFITYAKNNLSKANFTILSPLMEMYNLKFVKRTGWVDRKIKFPESVASHSLFGYFMAKIYLPTECPDIQGYNKERILNILLIHDIAEARIGDIIKKTDEDKANEAIYYEELKWVSYLLQNENDLHSVESLWEDLEHGITNNGKIAKEIDKIEGYTQLLYYSLYTKDEITEEQIQFWENDFKGQKSLKFEITKNLFNIIKSHFKR